MRIFLVAPANGLRSQIEAEDDFTLVGQASTASEVLPALAPAQADVVVIDVHVPDNHAVELCQEIRSLYPEFRCLLTTPYLDDEAVTGALLAPAPGGIGEQTPGPAVLSA